MIGNTLSHYKIISKLGQGGMGEVYLAEDSRLDRKVALKILPQHLSERAELRERFEREARAVSSLNHPHICTLYDIGEQDGIHYLVMEHLVGETLEARLVKGPLPLEQTLEYAIQIADALDKAHRQGVVHRDLKPGNIMLVKSGAKLLDFGLAKLQAAETPTNLSALPTEQANLTAEGTILGTLQYMAPEQLEGKEADSRTDIFAFGAVVYEMATGKKAFEGKSQASLIAAIMGQDPRPMAELQPMTPALFDRVVKMRCLAKVPDERWQTASDLTAELKWITEPVAVSNGAGGIAQPARRKQEMLFVLTVAMAIIAGIALWSPWRESMPRSRTLTRFPIALAAGQHLPLAADDPYGNRPAVVISPDGQHLVYVASLGGDTEVFLRDLDQMEAQAIPGTEGAREAFFSPDGQWIGFYTERELKKVALTGARPTTLSEVPPVLAGASWAANETILFGFENGPLSSFSTSGGGREAVSELNSQRESHRWPDILPGGKAVVFTVFSANDPNTSRIVALSLDTRETKTLIEGGTSAHYSSTGHLIYASTGRLFAAPFDMEQLEVTGPSVLVLDDVMIDQDGGAHFSLSSDGTLVYVPGTADAVDRRLVWVDRSGVTEVISAPVRWYSNPVLSPERGRIAVEVNTAATEDVWIYDLVRGTLERLTLNGGGYPLWSPDGSRIVFHRIAPPRHYDLFWQASDGGSAEEVLLPKDDLQFTGAWSPDGETLAFVQTISNGVNLDIWTLSLEGERKAEVFLNAPFDEVQPSFSSDGKWLAYVSDEAGRNEVYVRPFANSGGRTQVSTQGGTEPRWARNGRELFFRSGNKMMVVEISTEPALKATAPRVLFEGRYIRSGTRPGYPEYDVTADGRRFVMVQPVEPESAPTQINVVLNWFEELKRLVPTN